MLNIGNKKLKMSNVGTTPLDSIYLGSTLILKKIKYVQWYDPEFKRIILEKYNNGKEMTQDQLNKFRSQSKLSESDIILDHNLFENNQKLLSIKDLEKFVNFDVISPNMFAGCSKLGTTNLESTKDIDDHILEIPNNITDIGSGCKYIQGNSGNSNNSKYIIVCRATTPPLLTLGGPNYKYNNLSFDPNYNKAYPFISGAAHIYVPDESVDLYKNDNKYGIQEQYSDEITEHTGTVECYGKYELKERNIS